MGDKSGIEWTDASWNPVTGCTKVSPGCAHCYIESTPPFRMQGRRFVKGDIPLVFYPDRLDRPLRWKRPRRIFVNSLSDLFHEAIPIEFLDEVFLTMARASQHTFQVLTKRPERMVDYIKTRGQMFLLAAGKVREINMGAIHWPPANVWLGVSVENQRVADERIPLLLETPAAVRFLSCEPLLAALNLDVYLGPTPEDEDGAPYPGPLHWVILGGESGPGARPCDVGWVRSIRDQCRAASTPCFVKQLGSRPLFPDDECAIGNEPIHGKGGKMEEWPEDLRVREWPRVVAE